MPSVPRDAPVAVDQWGEGLDAAARTLVDSLVAMSTDLDLDRVLARLVRAGCEITGATYGALGVIDESGDNLRAFITHGMSEQESSAIGSLPVGKGILGLLIREAKTIRLSKLQDHQSSVGFPLEHPPMTSFLGVPVVVRGAVFGNLYLCDKAERSDFTEKDERFVEVLAAAAAHVIDNARIFGRSERRRLWLESLAIVGEALQEPPDVAGALRQTAISVRRIAGASAVAVLRVEDEDFSVVAVDGPDAGLLSNPHGELQRLLRSAVGLEGLGSQFGLAGRTALLIPLREHLGSGAAVALVTEAPLEGEVEDLLTSFIDQVALALDRTSALRQRAESALLADRDRIARDLHDVVIQRLFATGLKLQGARRSATDPEVLARIGEATNSLDETIRDIRSTIFDLQEAGAPSLRAQVHQLLGEYTELLGHRPSVRTTGPLDTMVDEAMATQVLAVLREALSNVAKHAQANATRIELNLADRQLCVVVTDDGIGLPEVRKESGLANQRRRASALGGTVGFTRPASGGTEFKWQAPLA